jgi:hypothetical protein
MTMMSEFFKKKKFTSPFLGHKVCFACNDTMTKLLLSLWLSLKIFVWKNYRIKSLIKRKYIKHIAIQTPVVPQFKNLIFLISWYIKSITHEVGGCGGEGK